jgi:predicted dehydrogenase
MNEPVRIGIIGCGQMGRIHAAGYQKAGARVVAVADIQGEAARSLAGELGAEAYTDYRAMLAAGGLDAVSVTTPPAMHRENVAAVAEAGLPVFCEKPLAESLPSARALVAEVEAAGVPFMVGFFHRFHEPLVKLKELLEAGTFGRPVTIRSRFGVSPTTDRRPWIKDPAIAGGGAMMDTAVHSMDIVRFLSGAEIVSVQAVTDGKPMEETTLVILTGSSGDLGLVEAYGAAPFRTYELWLQGSSGEAMVGWHPPSLRVRTKDEPQWRDVAIEATDAMDRFHAGIAYFVACIRTGRRPDRATGLDGVRAIELADAAYRAARTGTRAGPGRE